LAHTYEGGDHRIYVGEVKALSTGGLDRDSLGYFRGRYVTSPPPD
jgi:flavin reductase (DIM6/NTAB) family NADH-FMN oxidoreductase RutF